MTAHRLHHRADLLRIARETMSERGLAPMFSPQAMQQLASITGPAREANPAIENLTGLLWCSIDNDDSLDLDQLTVCEPLADGSVQLLVAIADVDALVKKDSPLDAHARMNTATVYTSAQIFPMLPERLSTDLTSLNLAQDRLALVTAMVFRADASLAHFSIFRALVHNHAKLAYDAVAAWLSDQGERPAAAAQVPGMEAQLRHQSALAQQLRQHRQAQGALEFETFQPQAVFEGEKVVDIRQQVHNLARQLIEEVMIAANGCAARFLALRGGTGLHRVVRSPERWLRIVQVARSYGESLPTEPDSVALADFLARRHKADPLRFPDLSLVIIKLMGSGQYVVEAPGAAAIGHFGLAVRDYAHSTAPNRRFPDLITARLLKAALAGEPAPYSNAELAALALHCTRQEDAVRKVERKMRKAEAALLLESRIGQHFDALIIGNTDAGVWVRIFSPPAEGKLAAGAAGLQVGDKLRVELTSTDVEQGFIDFIRAA